MSHFSLMVRLPSAIHPDAIDRALADVMQPFHEFECTGVDDKFVQTIDKTEEARKEYDAATSHQYKDPEGRLHDPYQDRFYRDPTHAETLVIGPLSGTGGNGELSWSSRDWGDGRGYRAKVHQLPEGWAEVDIKEARPFEEWAAGWYGGEILRGGAPKTEAHKHGWIEVLDDGAVKVIRRTNPDKKWDWWQVGGRWSDRLPTKHAGNANIARVGDLDWNAIDSATQAKATAFLVEWEALLGGKKFGPFDGPRDTALSLGWLDCKSASELTGGEAWIEQWSNDRDRYDVVATLPNVAQEMPRILAQHFAVGTWAYLDRGEWHEKGKMGWFGTSNATPESTDANRRSQIEWLKALADSGDWIVVVDCHI